MAKSILPVIVAFVVAQLGAAVHAQQVASAQDNEARIRQLKVPLPLADSYVCRGVGLWAALAHVPVGVECTAQKPRTMPMAPEKSRIETMLDLSGLRFDEALKMLLEHAAESQYEAHSRAGYVVVRRRGMPGEEAALDRRVPRFVLKNANLVQAGQEIRRVFTPEYVANAERLYGRDRPLPPPSRPEPDVVRQFREVYNKQFSEVRSLELMNVSVEDILIAVARVYGDYSWMIEYAPGSRRFDDVLLQFVSVGKQNVSFAPMRPVVRSPTR